MKKLCVFSLIIACAWILVCCGKSEDMPAKNMADESNASESGWESESTKEDKIEITIDAADFINKMFELGDDDAFPENPYTLHISGFDTEVFFSMSGYANPISITAYGQTIELDERVYLYGNCGFDLFEYNNAVILTWDFYGVGYTYVIGEGFSDRMAPGLDTTPLLMLNDEGKLVYERVNNRIADIIQTGSLSSAVGYDMFFRSKGSADIVDGKIALGEETERLTISDVYDPDGEFEDYYKDRYSSIEEIFEQNRGLYSDPDSLLQQTKG